MHAISNSPVQSQSQKMTGSLVMTPQLQRKLALLSVPVQDIAHEINLELENNPALEISKENELESLERIEERKNKSEAGKLQFEMLEQVLSLPETLSEHLIWQLRMEQITEREYSIGVAIIENLNENGFFIESPYEYCMNEFDATKEEVANLITLIQEFEPEGCATSGVMESLKVQLSFLDLHESQKAIIEDCLLQIEQLLMHSPKNIEVEVEKYLNKHLTSVELQNYLQHLVPYPGRQFASSHVEKDVYVIPDATILLQDGELVAKTNDDRIPVLSITNTMLQSKKSQDKEEKEFAERWIETAETFIQGLEYRNSTLEKVISFVVQYHKDFFLGNTKFLGQLTRKQLAEKLELSESTISRVISNKYLQSDKGTFKLSYFFSQGVGDTEASSQKVALEIQDIISELQKKNQKISDRIISEILEERGITIARRTVAKYRSKLLSI